MSKRCRGLSMEQRAYRWALDKGEFRVAALRVALKMTYWQAIQSCNRLCRKGCMERLGANHWHRRFLATDIAPDDLRGTAPASLEALRARMQKPKRRIPVPVATTELERAWGFLPFSKVAPSIETCANDGGTLRPQETEAA